MRLSGRWLAVTGRWLLSRSLASQLSPTDFPAHVMTYTSPSIFNFVCVSCEIEVERDGRGLSNIGGDM